MEKPKTICPNCHPWPHKIVLEVLGETGVEEVIPVRSDMMLRSQGTISFLSVQKGTGCRHDASRQKNI